MALAVAVTATTTILAIRMGIERQKIEEIVEQAADKYMFDMEDLDRFLGIDTSDIIVWRKNRPLSHSSGFLLFAERERPFMRALSNDDNINFEATLKTIIEQWNSLSWQERDSWNEIAKENTDNTIV